jgi:hypothetical protein
MPYLFCAEHGEEYQARVSEKQELYRQEGETILVVSGRLRSGPWLCDKCNALLGKGVRATLAVVYPRYITETIHEYDFAYERRYFAVENAEVAVYGAEWPVVMRPGSEHRARRTPRQRPLCALDLKKPERTDTAE